MSKRHLKDSNRFRLSMVKYSSGSRKLMLLAKIIRLTPISMMDSYIFGFLLSKINVNLFWTSGPIEKFVESLFFIKVIWCMLYFLVVFQFTYRWCSKFTFVTFLDMFVSSHPEWCVHYRGSDKTEKGSRKLSLYRFLVRAGTRSQIKHGEIGEDSKAAPQKVNQQYMAKNQN